MKLTQSKIILEVLKDRNDWIPSYELAKVSTKWGWIGLQGDRRARELAESGMIERKHEKGYAWYKIKDNRPPQVPYQYRREEVKNLTLKI